MIVPALRLPTRLAGSCAVPPRRSPRVLRVVESITTTDGQRVGCSAATTAGAKASR